MVCGAREPCGEAVYSPIFRLAFPEKPASVSRLHEPADVALGHAFLKRLVDGFVYANRCAAGDAQAFDFVSVLNHAEPAVMGVPLTTWNAGAPAFAMRSAKTNLIVSSTPILLDLMPQSFSALISNS
jgi:hypothetical protein